MDLLTVGSVAGFPPITYALEGIPKKYPKGEVMIPKRIMRANPMLRITEVTPAIGRIKILAMSYGMAICIPMISG